MSSIPPWSLAAALFVPEEGDYYQCRLCFLRRKQANGTGYTKLVEHLIHYHASTYEDEFRSVQRRVGSLDAFVICDEFSWNVYHWLDWVAMENRELSMCEKPKTRKYTHLKPLSVNTLKKHMFALETVVQTSIKKNLEGKKIGFAVDAWTEDGTRFVAIVAITPTDKFLLLRDSICCGLTRADAHCVACKLVAVCDETQHQLKMKVTSVVTIWLY